MRRTGRLQLWRVTRSLAVCHSPGIRSGRNRGNRRGNRRTGNWSVADRIGSRRRFNIDADMENARLATPQMGAATRCEPVPGNHWRTGSPRRVYDSTRGQEHACRTAGRACAAAADRTRLEAAAVGGNPYQPLDPGLEFSDARVGRTDRPGFIVSSLTINEFYLHDLPLPVCGSLQNDASIAASFRLSGRGAHSPSPWRSSIGCPGTASSSYSATL